jgi:heme exporter protein A
VSANRIEFRRLSRRFGRLAVLARVDGRVASGEVLPVRGRNGSGKSTLLRCLAGLLAPDAGEVLATEEGRALEGAERRRRVGYVAPDLAFYEELTVGENLDFFSRLRGTPSAAATQLLARVALPAERRAGALSSGMRQRLRWAFALLHQPRLLLLDEPFQNLDGPGEETARALLAEHLAAGGLAVVASPVPLSLPASLDAIDLDR